MSGINESGTVSELWNSVWYQELWNNNGLTLDKNRQLSLSAGTQPYSNIIISEYTCICVHIILQCPLQISNISITKDDEGLLSNKYNSAAQMFRMSIKVECCNKDVEQFSSSLSVGRNFKFGSPFLIREPPQFEGSAVRHSSPFVVLVTIFFKKRWWNILQHAINWMLIKSTNQ